MVIVHISRWHLNKLFIELITETPPQKSLCSTEHNLQNTEPFLQHHGRWKAYAWTLPSSDKKLISCQGNPCHSSPSQPLYMVPNLLPETSTQKSKFWPLELLSSSAGQKTATESTSRSSFRSSQRSPFLQSSLLWHGPRLLDHPPLSVLLLVRARNIHPRNIDGLKLHQTQHVPTEFLSASPFQNQDRE